MRNLGGCICGRKKFVKYVTFGRIQSALTYANIPHNAAETCSHIRKCYVYTCHSKMAAYEQLADNVLICCRFIVLHIRFLRDAALFSIRIIAEIYAYSIDFFFKTQICDRQNFSIFVETLTIMSHSFQIHENAVYPYKPHQSTARICKGIRPYSSLFVLIRP